MPNIYKCNCGKIYKDRSGLWYHKKNCKVKKEEEENSMILVEKEKIRPS